MQTKILKDRPTLLVGKNKLVVGIAPLPHAGYGPEMTTIE